MPEDGGLLEEITPKHPAFRELFEPRLYHSGYGIASTLVGLITMFMGRIVLNGMFQFIALTRGSSGRMAELYQMLNVIGLGMNILLPLLGLGLATAGLMQAERRREYAIVGLALNAILLAGAIATYGLSFGMRFFADFF